jgi:hypothetical protein
MDGSCIVSVCVFLQSYFNAIVWMRAHWNKESSNSSKKKQLREYHQPTATPTGIYSEASLCYMIDGWLDGKVRRVFVDVAGYPAGVRFGTRMDGRTNGWTQRAAVVAGGRWCVLLRLFAVAPCV